MVPLVVNNATRKQNLILVQLIEKNEAFDLRVVSIHIDIVCIVFVRFVILQTVKWLCICFPLLELESFEHQLFDRISNSYWGPMQFQG